MTLLGCHERHLPLLPHTFELRFIRDDDETGSVTPKPLVFWAQPGTESRRVKFPKDWSSVAMLRLAFNRYSNYHLDIVNDDHPMVFLLSPKQRESVTRPNSIGHRFWSELSTVKAAGESAWALLRAALSLSEFQAMSSTSWEKFAKENKALLDAHWSLIGQAAGVDRDSLEIRIGGPARDVFISRQESEFSKIGFELRSVLPDISDPDFLLVKENEPLVG